MNYTNFLWIIFYAKCFWNPYFTYYSNYLILEWRNFVLFPTQFDLVNYLYMTFHWLKMVLFLFPIFWHASIPPSFLMLSSSQLFSADIFCTCVELFISITRSCKSNMNDSFWIISLKIIITKANIINIFVLKPILSRKNITVLEIISSRSISLL